MRVRVTITVEIDPDKWVEEYGTVRARVRDDVRDYIENAVRESEGIRECAPS